MFHPDPNAVRRPVGESFRPRSLRVPSLPEIVTYGADEQGRPIRDTDCRAHVERGSVIAGCRQLASASGPPRAFHEGCSRLELMNAQRDV